MTRVTARSPRRRHASLGAGSMDTFDLIVIGGGSAGLAACEQAVRLGARVALVERNPQGPGGDCLWTGCVPSKALLRAAHVAHLAGPGNALGLSGEGLRCTDLGAVMAHVHRAQARIEPHDSRARLQSLGVTVFETEGRFVAPHDVVVDGRVAQGRTVLIATGSHAASAPVAGLGAAGFLTNESIFELRTLPRAMLVLGAGPVGLELAQAFARLGSKVTVVDVADRVLPAEDDAVSDYVERALRAEGVELCLQTRAVSVIRLLDGRRRVCLEDRELGRELVVDEVLVATGRRPNTESLALERAGIERSPEGFVRVDPYLETTAPNVFACGDVVGRYLFTHVAAAEALTAVRNALLPGHARMDYSVVPWATFTDPEVGRVGLREREARERYGDGVQVYSLELGDVDRAITDDAARGFVKVIATPAGRILGAHLVSPEAGELVNEVALAMRRGIGLADIAGTMHVYPTLALALQQVSALHVRRRLETPLARSALRAARALRRGIDRLLGRTRRTPAATRSTFGAFAPGE